MVDVRESKLILKINIKKKKISSHSPPPKKTCNTFRKVPTSIASLFHTHIYD